MRIRHHLSILFLYAKLNIVYSHPDESHVRFDGGFLEQENARDATLIHPGIFVGSTNLKRMAAKVSAKAQPWFDAYNSMMNDRLAKRDIPKPYESVDCGGFSTPGIGCTDERRDAQAAYLNALAWATSNDKSYAARAIGFMNAWAQTIKAHTLSNAPLQAAWAAADWARAGEIIRYTDGGWEPSDITAFEDMLRNVYLPLVVNGSTNFNNWNLRRF